MATFDGRAFTFMEALSWGLGKHPLGSSVGAVGET